MLVSILSQEASNQIASSVVIGITLVSNTSAPVIGAVLSVTETRDIELLVDSRLFCRHP